MDKDDTSETMDTIENKLLKLELRIKELEDKLDEKDRELREVSINRAEFVQQLNMIYNMLKKARFYVGSGELVKRALGLDQKTISNGTETTELEILKENDKEIEIKDESEKDLKSNVEPTDQFDGISNLEPEKLEFLGKYSYRERMILMNRIDIYRLYTTVMILSSQIRYPRTMTDIEEKELRDFIKELTEFENLVLDLNIEEDLIWDKGKVCEKQAIQLFNRFFNI
jgi:hypothetical protein